MHLNSSVNLIAVDQQPLPICEYVDITTREGHGCSSDAESRARASLSHIRNTSESTSQRSPFSERGLARAACATCTLLNITFRSPGTRPVSVSQSAARVPSRPLHGEPHRSPASRLRRSSVSVPPELAPPLSAYRAEGLQYSTAVRSAP